MSITLCELPYKQNELEPYVSSKTLEFHYGKHHSAYVNNLNKLIEGTDLEKETLENIVVKTASQPDRIGIFNNAAQIWNHTFYWQSLKPASGGVPTGSIAKRINYDYGDYDSFAEELKNAGLAQFGSGWVWLVLEQDRLKIMKTSNADTPIAHHIKTLMTIDVWEHAYYIDYQNRRSDYLDAIIKNLINWEYVNDNLE